MEDEEGDKEASGVTQPIFANHQVSPPERSSFKEED